MAIPIGKLEKHVDALSRQLNREGFDTSYIVERSGRNSDPLYTTNSHVSLEICKSEEYLEITFWANGYGCSNYGQMQSWSDMKSKALLDIKGAMLRSIGE